MIDMKLTKRNYRTIAHSRSKQGDFGRIAEKCNAVPYSLSLKKGCCEFPSLGEVDSALALVRTKKPGTSPGHNERKKGLNDPDKPSKQRCLPG
jgi:hypothetical protein